MLQLHQVRCFPTLSALLHEHVAVDCPFAVEELGNRALEQYQEAFDNMV
jgi:hypothetical protein